MPKRRLDEDPEHLSIPLPIQNFLWQQTRPFIRPKIGKLHEASGMEQREACKSFEKVLVQNIDFGLSPSLAEAIRSISRWRLVQAAFPHVMHCCAALLYRRKDRCLSQLGTPETKLLYTMHWIIVDAMEECADAEKEKGIFYPRNHYLFPVSAIQVFVYLFAPLGDFMKHSEFVTCPRLENGFKLWEALWEFKHPNFPCFTTQVMPKRTFLRGKREKQNLTNLEELVISEVAPSKTPIKEQCSASLDSSDTGPTVTSPISSNSENVLKEDVESNRFLSKETEAKKNPLFCEICLMTAVKSKDDSNVYKCKCGYINVPKTEIKQDATEIPETKPSISKPSKVDVAMATYMDVAVLRCLFISQWLDEGIYWALKYLYQRLKDIKEVTSDVASVRKRSCSLPIPEIEISLYQSPEQKKKEYSSGMENIFTVDPSYQPPSHHTSMHELHQSSFDGHSEKQRSKRMKMGDLKLFVEEKFRLSERLLDRIGKESSHCSSLPESRGISIISESYRGSEIKSSLSSEHLEMQRPKSALAMLDHKHSESEDTDTSDLMRVEMVRGRSMPSLHHYGEHPKFDSFVSRTPPPQPLSLGVKKVPAYHTFSVPNPIITVTEHSPVASVQFFLNQDSASGQRDDSSPPTTPNPSCQQFTITRSQTDSNISYESEFNTEVTGSTYYITPDGEICLEVVLKAVHSVSLGDSSLSVRVCEIALNLLDILLSFGIVSKADQDQIEKSEEALITTPGTDNSILNPSEKSKSSSEKKNDELSLHHLFMDILWRICKYLGCPHSCGEGGHRCRSTSELLRLQILNAFNKLYETDQRQFRTFLRDIINQRSLLEIIDFFHSFVGFCNESGSPISPVPQKRTSSSGSQENFRHSYGNNFGAGFGKSGVKDAEGLVMSSSFKAFVSRLVLARKELKSQENMALYRSIRQFMSYVREFHGGVFRRVALSGLIDSAERPHKKNKNTIATTRIVRHTKSVDHEDYRDPIYSPTVFVVDETALTKSTRKSFFKKRGVRKVPSAQLDSL